MVEQELSNEFVLKNISGKNFGRVDGKEGQKIKELQRRFPGIKVIVMAPSGPRRSVTVKIKGSDSESRRTAGISITESLPIEVDGCFQRRRLTSQMMKRAFVYKVEIEDVGHYYKISKFHPCFIIGSVLATLALATRHESDRIITSPKKKSVS